MPLPNGFGYLTRSNPLDRGVFGDSHGGYIPPIQNHDHIITEAGDNITTEAGAQLITEGSE